MKKRILIVDDDVDLLQSLDLFLARQGFEVSSASDGDSALGAIKVGGIDLILLDVNFPNENGFEIAKRIRVESAVPIIMLTQRSGEVDKIVGLDVGADDYVAKPFSAGELTARINAVLRRFERSAEVTKFTDEPGGIGEFKGWQINVNRRRLFSPDGQDVGLTVGEFNLLLALARFPFHVRSREQLLEALGEDAAEAFDRAIDTRITRLRQKIEPNPKEPIFVKTERGVGYVFSHKVTWR